MANTNSHPTNDLIIAHMSTIQGIITRFASNSAACKNMCLTLVAAVLALLAANKEPQTLKIGYIVVSLMAWMDAYYLHLERLAVELSKKYAAKIQKGEFAQSDLFKVGINTRGLLTLWGAFKCLLSHSIWPFYGVLTACLVMIQWYFANISK